MRRKKGMFHPKKDKAGIYRITLRKPFDQLRFDRILLQVRIRRQQQPDQARQHNGRPELEHDLYLRRR